MANVKWIREVLGKWSTMMSDIILSKNISKFKNTTFGVGGLSVNLSSELHPQLFEGVQTSSLSTLQTKIMHL